MLLHSLRPMVDCLYGCLHAFAKAGETPGRLLIVNTPGRMHHKFFSEAGDALPEATTEIPEATVEPDISHILAIAAEAEMTIVLPD
jgi:hypothetical protein